MIIYNEEDMWKWLYALKHTSEQDEEVSITFLKFLDAFKITTHE